MKQDGFDIAFYEEKGEIRLAGRFDASQVTRAQAVLDAITDSTVVDFTKLMYISSAGLALLLGTQKRLMDRGKGLTLINLNEFVANVFELAGFYHVFEIR